MTFLFCHSRNLLSGIHIFAFSFGFQILWTPDRTIQGQAKYGLKIAGVTNLRERKRAKEEGKKKFRDNK